MRRVAQLSNTITTKLMREIREGIYSGLDALPSEIELAESMKVSRNVIRETLTSLEREGWVTRKHGVGTLINKRVVHVNNRLDQTCELTHAIELSGQKSSRKIESAEVVRADYEVAENLALAVGTPVFCIRQVFYADEKPAAYCIDYIPLKYIRKKKPTAADVSPNAFRFLEKHCGGVIPETFISEVRAAPATAEVAQALDVPEGMRLLTLGEVGCDLRSTPIIYSYEYFVDRIMRHVIIRKMI